MSLTPFQQDSNASSGKKTGPCRSLLPYHIDMYRGRRSGTGLLFLSAMGLTSLSAQVAQPELQIMVIGGEGSVNNIKQRTAREPVVEIRDKNDRPVAGALVLFAAPDRGASGVFLDGTNRAMVTTDAQGRAVARGFKPNTTQGSFQVKVSVSYQGQTATATISMQNVAGAGAGAAKSGVSGKVITILVVAAAGAAGGIFAATRGGGSSPSGPPVSPTSITAGAGTVGPRP